MDEKTARKRGELRIHLGAAPGVGKTFAMLGEAHRRRERGTDIVVGFAETHGRAKTAELLDGLETVPRRQIHHCGVDFTEMDVEELLDAGIDVLSTVNVQHLESLNDVVQRITGVQQRGTVHRYDRARRRHDLLIATAANNLLDVATHRCRARYAPGIGNSGA